MILVRRDINLTNNEMIRIYNGFIDDEEYNIEKSIKVYKTQTINVNFIKTKNGNNRVIISLVDDTTSREKVIKVFDKIVEYNSLAYIGFVKNDYFFMFKTNMNNISYNYNYSECIEPFEHTGQKDTYLYVLINFLKSPKDDDGLQKLASFICRNINYQSKFISDFFLQKIDYLGFDELYSKYDYKKLTSSSHDRTVNIISFLIYCLKCINASEKNIYTPVEIESISEDILNFF